MTDAAPTDIRTAALVKHALAYAKRGWHVFPIYEVAATGICSCRRGAECGNAGKHPRTPAGFKNASTDEAQIRDWWKRWPLSNVGIACGASRLAVIDVDPRNHGDETLRELEAKHAELPQTARAATGGAGQHYLYQWPEDRTVKSGVLGLGVDLKADGGYIVAAPSNHVSGRCYDWDAGAHPRETPIQEAPKWVLNLVGSKSTKQYRSAGGVTDGFLGAAFDEAGWLGQGLGPDKQAARCPWEHEHTTGARFDSSTIVFAPAQGYRVGWFWCSHGHCQGSRTIGSVLAALPAEAKDRARERLKLDPQYDPGAEEKKRQEPRTVEADGVGNEWAAALRRNQEGNITKDAGNAALILANLAEWRGCLEYDAFADRIRWVRPVPELPGLPAPHPGDDLSDHHVLYVHHWLAKLRRVAFAKTAVQDALESAARANEVHPVRSYLDSLTWDGRRRADQWLKTYLGAPDEPYVHAVGRWWLISAVARIYQPGCQADHLVVLEGVQGSGKSTAARILGGDWFLASLPDITNKDAAAVLQGHWIVEIGELDAFKGAAGTRVKDWVTRTVDSYRPAYGRFTVRRPRSCVFLGTTNEGTYLGDSTGARRFWPVACRDLCREALNHDRAQLWAEAKRYYDSGEPWWPSEDMQPAVRQQQEARYQRDEWESKIADWVGPHRDGFTMGDVLATGLGIEPGKWDRNSQTRAGMCLRRLGFQSKMNREHGKTVRRYWANRTGNPDADWSNQ